MNLWLDALHFEHRENAYWMNSVLASIRVYLWWDLFYLWDRETFRKSNWTCGNLDLKINTFYLPPSTTTTATLNIYIVHIKRQSELEYLLMHAYHGCKCVNELRCRKMQLHSWGKYLHFQTKIPWHRMITIEKKTLFEIQGRYTCNCK